MNILILGSGGREHALCWKIAQSPFCSRLYCIPGNAGIARHFECPRLKLDDFKALTAFAKVSNIDFTIVGPEKPLVDGIVDAFQATELKIFGPSASAALLEGDKAFAKELMAEHNIPTAKFSIHQDYYDVFSSPFIKKFPLVIKVAGLAAGKGVAIITNHSELENFLGAIYRERKFGPNANTVVVEECLFGEELSFFALTDGTDFITFPVAQDHKRIGEGDTGPNTGGMGAYSPVPVATPELIKEIEEGIVIPTLAAMRERNSPYRGLLYCGLMLTDKGPRVLEFNCRFGDPETQCVLPLIKADLLEMLLSTIEEGGITGWKEKHPDFIYPGYSACVVLASQGYPGEYKTGATITGIDKEYPETVIFHAGTKFIEGRFQTAGGRVLAVTGSGKTLGAALNNAYSSIEKINFEGKYYRRDIGRKALRM